MEIRNHLLNQKGQILIESMFLAFVLASVLIVFSKLIDFKKSKSSYNYETLKKTDSANIYAR